MEPPAPKTVTHALIAGLLAGVIALAIIEVIDLVISRVAHHQSKQIDTEVWNYYAVRDATAQFLGTLYGTVSGNGNGGADGPAIGGGGERATERHADDAGGGA